MTERALRIALPVLVLVAGVLLWDLIVRVFAIPPYLLPAPGLVLATLVADAGLLWNSLLRDAAHDTPGLSARGGRGCRPRNIVQSVAAGRILVLSIRGDPPGDTDRRHRAAAADLLAAAAGSARLRLDRRVLSGARQHNARPNSIDHNLLALFDLYKASRWRSCGI